MGVSSKAGLLTAGLAVLGVLVAPGLALADGYPPSAPASLGASSSVCFVQTDNLAGTGFAPGEVVTFVVQPGNTTLGTVTADPLGSFSLSFPCSSLSPGSVTITATGKTSGDVASYLLTVPSPGSSVVVRPHDSAGPTSAGGAQSAAGAGSSGAASSGGSSSDGTGSAIQGSDSTSTIGTSQSEGSPLPGSTSSPENSTSASGGNGADLAAAQRAGASTLSSSAFDVTPIVASVLAVALALGGIAILFLRRKRASVSDSV